MIGADQISRLALPNTPMPVKSDARVKEAAEARQKNLAKEFEATFISMLLKEMRQTLEPEGGLFPGDTGDIQGGLFDLFLGRHIAESGGVGLAAAMVRQFQSSAGASTTPATPADDLSPRLPGAAIPPSSAD